MKVPLGVQRFFSSRLVRVGGPFVTILVLGSFALKEFASIRVDVVDSWHQQRQKLYPQFDPLPYRYVYRRQRPIEPKEAEKYGIRMKPKEAVRLDQQYQEIESQDIDCWENKRGPRPWEESEAMNELIRRRDARAAASAAASSPSAEAASAAN